VAESRDDAAMMAAYDLIDALGAFDLIVPGAAPDESDASADLTRGVCWLDLEAWDESDEHEGELVHRAMMLAYLAVSDTDRRAAALRLGRLEALVCNALSGVSLGGLTLPALTLVRKSRKDKHAKPPQRRHVLTVEWAYLVDEPGGHDEADDEA
jgi:hypothetical protein